ncbi:polyprenyl synthetase family protein [Clostridium aminobutyricum]|uniref:Polyprenyl synthetase family protein n=1 Tax=Clostridium aminobutyricum TaxID=33953 RepID=A0A939D781_CLOAM|nr:polyprenyl synthetase family protein [Clostridium aminobutyricum]MBN7772502.1 polyprenyl synthetase family protein [Clostridium aminobutyricum]
MNEQIKLEEIYAPVSNHLRLLEEQLDHVIQNLCGTNNKEVLEHAFKIPGKRMRPALLLLSASAVNPKISLDIKAQLIQLSAAIELIHTASLIHDDVIDEDSIRRGQKTLNNVFGNKIAVLAGDILNSRAFLIISRQLPVVYHDRLAQMIETMGLAEIEQLKSTGTIPTKEEYLKIINGKTAVFIGNSCRFGAMLAGGSEKEITALENYGMNVGMAYQLIDDFIDQEIVSIQYDGLKEAEEYIKEAKNSLGVLEDTVYKQKLLNFSEYILAYASV